MRKIFRWVWSVLEVIIIVYVIFMTSFILCKNKYGYTQFGDYTFNSIDLMDERNIQNTKKGDLLIVKNSNDIRVGDVVYYYTPFNESYIIRSDVVKEKQDDDYSSLYKVERDGSDISFVSSRVLGKYANTYHKIGGILELLETRIGFLFLVLLPIMIVFIYQVYEFFVIIKYDEVDDGEESGKAEEKEESLPSTPVVEEPTPQQDVSTDGDNFEPVNDSKKVSKFSIQGFNEEASTEEKEQVSEEQESNSSDKNDIEIL